MLGVVRKIHSILDRQERREFLLLVFVVLSVGIIEVAGIASIMPFMAVVANPEVVETNAYLNYAYETLGFDSTRSFLVFLGLVVFSVILISNILKATVLFLELRFVHLRLYSVSRRLLFSYLNKPYTFYLNNNTSVLGKNILQEVSKFSHEVLRPCTQILTRIVIILFILILLLIVDPVLAVTIASILGGAYLLLYYIIQRNVMRLGRERFEANEQRSKAAAEVFGGVKDLKILNRERFYFDSFSHQAKKCESKMVYGGIIGQLPSYVMEVLAFGGILIIVLYFLMVRQDFGQALPVVALYAFAGYRMMPALQGTFSAVTLLRFNLPVLDKLAEDLGGITEVPSDWQMEKVAPLPFHEKIELSSVTFTYPGSESPTIRDLNLTIRKNTSIGLAGATGSGKTTVVDIILGLLAPEQGTLAVDGKSVTAGKMLRWQRNLGYVPQSIFLCDDSLAANIAFGVDPSRIDTAAVERAARIANLHDFVMNELPDGYATQVGERGVRLSGGQRQRIGIARALYHDPEVLIMDEATSALDTITEEAVIQAIRNLAGKKTIITIAHRLTTLRDCDLVFIMENGEVIETGTYAELSRSSTRFRALAKAAESDRPWGLRASMS